MANEEYYLRRSRQSKRRKNKRNFWFLIFLAFIFVILLFVLVNFGGKDSSPSETAENTENTNNDETSSEKANNSNQEETSNAEDNETNENNEENNDDSEDNEDDDSEDETSTEEVDSDDPNVTKDYKGEWDPVDTEQSVDHTTNYEDASQGRTEIKQAIADATCVSEDQMIEHWVGNQGEQYVTSTSQDESTDQFYRVSLEWIEGAGWQPNKVEEWDSFEKYG